MKNKNKAPKVAKYDFKRNYMNESDDSVAKKSSTGPLAKKRLK
jgi:hypothetical protein